MEFLAGQGLGNQLWVYAATRSIAEQLKLPFAVHSPEQFKGAAFLDLEMPTAKGQEAWRPFQERLYYDVDMDYTASDYDARVERLDARTILHGLFQSEKYFFGDLDRPRRYISLKDPHKSAAAVDAKTCVLNIRGGEYKRHKRFILPASYWRNAMAWMKDRYGIENFVAVSDDDRYVKALLPGIRVLEGGIAQDYATLYQCEYAIVSNSSFAYFPLKTGRVKRGVVAPAYWARYNQPQYRRWASPANVYEGWSWMSPDGIVMPYEACVRASEETMRGYQERFHVLTSPEAITRKGLRHLVPSSLKPGLKKALSVVFPKIIG